jgi:hypothetical protein
VGTFTPNLKFYKADPSEFVDVDLQINSNWEIADAAVKQLLEYQFTTTDPLIPSTTVGRPRYYKMTSNSVLHYDGISSPKSFKQDTLAFVTPWQPLGSWVAEGFADDVDFPMGYRLIKKPGGTTSEVELCGAVQYINQAPIDLNFNLSFLQPTDPTLPIKPAVSKYFTMSAGNTSSDFSIARIFISSADGHMELKHYGALPSSGSSGENRIELTGIRYNIEVTG